MTRNCLVTLLPTLEGVGRGEVLVVDDSSRTQTAAVLAEFRWMRVVRNQANLGFAAACNQGARTAARRAIWLLNNDIVAQPLWLAYLLARLDPGGGIVGARISFPNKTIQHEGVSLQPASYEPEEFKQYHIFAGLSSQIQGRANVDDFDALSAACMLTPRALYLETDGFNQTFWHGYEEVDNVRAFASGVCAWCTSPARRCFTKDRSRKWRSSVECFAI